MTLYSVAFYAMMPTGNIVYGSAIHAFETYEEAIEESTKNIRSQVPNCRNLEVQANPVSEATKAYLAAVLRREGY